MKQLKYFLSGIFLFSMMMAHAADGDSSVIKRNVTIEKEYNPTIQDAGKINEIPSVVEPEIKKIDVTYSPYSLIMDPAYEIRQLESARLTSPPLPMRKDGYFRLGVGTKWSTLADFMYPLLNKPEYRLDFNLNHRGIFEENTHHKTNAGLAYRRYLTTGEFSMDAGYGFEGFNYYGANGLDTSTIYTNSSNAQFKGNDYLPETAKISTWKIAAGYNSLPSDKEKSFLIKLNYDGFSAKQGLTENVINTHVFYDKMIDENKAGIDVRLQNLLYSSKNIAYVPNQSSYSIFTLSPFFTFQQEDWFLHLGIKTNFSKKSEGKGFAPTADITGQVTLIDKSLYLYGGISGDYQANTMNSIEAYNRYINLNTKIKDTYTPLDLNVGTKLKLMYNFLVDVSVKYKMIKDQYFFVNEYLTNTATNATTLSNTFGVDYADANLLSTSFRINYNYNQDLCLLIGMKFNSWKLDNQNQAWQMPKYEFDFGTDMKLTKRTTVNIYSYVATGRKAKEADGSAVNMKAIADLNLGLFYAHSSKVSSFLKLNNILGKHYANWNGYEVTGFNVMTGLAFSF